MRLPTALAALAAAAFMAGAAHAQDPATDGQYRATLARVIVDAAQGVCPAEIMASELLAACEEQASQMAPAISSLGPVESMAFISAEGEGSERLELYEVTFASGQVLTFGIGGLVDGKFSTMFARG
jgi:hypothetical protein